jgi:4-hydroxyphenylacetate 3-monooxygenase
MVKSPDAWVNGAVQPNMNYGLAYRFLATIAYPRIKEIAEQTISSGLIYLNSHAIDFKTPEIRPYLDKYLRGSKGYDAIERVKLLKVLWDAVGTEFGGRHELYERNYAATTKIFAWGVCRPQLRPVTLRSSSNWSRASWPSMTSTAGAPPI